jgi:hypothetical protein
LPKSRDGPGAEGVRSRWPWTCVLLPLAKRSSANQRWRLGLFRAAGSTQRLPRLIGRGRALEVLLGCNDLSAELAERYGYINRALPADELTPFVEKLAHRIASFPAHAIAHAKAAVDTGAFSSMAEGLLVEAHESDLSVASEVTQARVTEALKVGAETYEGELEMDYLSSRLEEPDRSLRLASNQNVFVHLFE